MYHVVEKLAEHLEVTTYDGEAILRKVDSERAEAPSSGLWHDNHLTGKGEHWQEVLSEALIEKLEKQSKSG